MRLFFALLPVVLGVPAFFEAYIYHLHMFQLNSYHNDMERKWLWKNKTEVLRLFLPCFLGVLLTVLGHLLFPQGAVYVSGSVFSLIFGGLALFFRYRRLTKKAKKPLVFTDRVKRLNLTSFLIFGAGVLALFLIPGFVKGDFVKNGWWALVFEGTLTGIAPFFVLFANLLNKPVETGIRNRYIKEAKTLLRENKDLLVIGITGSYGKTSVKFFLTTLLSAKYNVLCTPENYNTPMGVVKTVRESLSPLHEIFVCEMGARRVGEIKELCDLVHPRYGIITSVGPQHLETFLTQERVRKTKFELAKALPEEGFVCLNADSEELMKEDYKGKKVLYSLEGVGQGDYHAENVSVSSEGTSFTLVHNEERSDFVTPVIGRHNVLNIVGALAMAHELGMSYEELHPQVRKLQSVPHRLQLLDRGNVALIDDAYNSNPTGAKAALDTLALFKGFRILVTPGMVELGEKMEECNRTFGKQAAKACDYAILVGKRQAEPILQGLLEGGFPKEKIYVAETIGEAISVAYSLPTGGEKPIILLENDLPDNY